MIYYVHKGLPTISSAGKATVVLRTITLYLNRKWETLDSPDSPSIYFMDFKACTIHLVRLFDAWWYDAVFKCVIPFCFSNSWSSKLENTAPLAESNVSGSPSIANVCSNFWFITAAVYVAIISNHLLCASIRYQTKHPLRHELTANTVQVDSQPRLI